MIYKDICLTDIQGKTDNDDDHHHHYHYDDDNNNDEDNNIEQGLDAVW